MNLVIHFFIFFSKKEKIQMEKFLEIKISRKKNCTKTIQKRIQLSKQTNLHAMHAK